VSDGFREVLLRNGVGSPETVTTIYNLPPSCWIDPPAEQIQRWRNRLHLEDKAPVVLAIGKRSLGKGTPWLVEAIRSVRSRVTNVVLVSVGKGPSLPEEPGLRTVNSQTPAELPALYALSTVVVIPSAWPEPFSRVFLEAMASGRIVIATQVGGSPEGVIPEVTGWLVPARDPAALADVIENAIRLRPERRKAMEAAARRLLHDRFACERSIGKLLSIYERSLEITLASDGAIIKQNAGFG
jgi:glycosyltransferase involved in cell wall biosynthesis